MKEFYIEENKRVFVLYNPKKLLNRYFLSNKKYLKIKIRKELFLGIHKFIFKILFKRAEILAIYKKLPKQYSLKQKLINLYSILLLSRGISKYKNSILIIGDYQNALNMSILQLTHFVENIEFWIINQGSGSMEKKLNFKYPKTVSKVFFPYAKESLYEQNLLSKASSKKRDIIFLNIDTTLNLNLSNKLNKLAIFHGYNKNYKLYPTYIIFIIKEIILINFLNELNNFDKVDFFLHPRLKYLLILKFFNLNNKLCYKVFDQRIAYEYKYIISYSPTINASASNNIKKSQKYLYEFGFKFNKLNIQKNINELLKIH